jgi:hypothetical protein
LRKICSLTAHYDTARHAALFVAVQDDGTVVGHGAVEPRSKLAEGDFEHYADGGVRAPASATTSSTEEERAAALAEIAPRDGDCEIRRMGVAPDLRRGGLAQRCVFSFCARRRQHAALHSRVAAFFKRSRRLRVSAVFAEVRA